MISKGTAKKFEELIKRDIAILISKENFIFIPERGVYVAKKDLKLNGQSVMFENYLDLKEVLEKILKRINPSFGICSADEWVEAHNESERSRKEKDAAIFDRNSAIRDFYDSVSPELTDSLVVRVIDEYPVQVEDFIRKELGEEYKGSFIIKHPKIERVENRYFIGGGEIKKHLNEAEKYLVVKNLWKGNYRDLINEDMERLENVVKNIREGNYEEPMRGYIDWRDRVEKEYDKNEKSGIYAILRGGSFPIACSYAGTIEAYVPAFEDHKGEDSRRDGLRHFRVRLMAKNLK